MVHFDNCQVLKNIAEHAHKQNNFYEEINKLIYETAYKGLSFTIRLSYKDIFNDNELLKIKNELKDAGYLCRIDKKKKLIGVGWAENPVANNSNSKFTPIEETIKLYKTSLKVDNFRQYIKDKMLAEARKGNFFIELTRNEYDPYELHLPLVIKELQAAKYSVSNNRRNAFTYDIHW